MTTRVNDISRSLAAFDEHSTLVIVVEMGHKSWLVAGLIPGVERHPKKKMDPDPEKLLGLLERWRGEAVREGCPSPASPSPIMSRPDCETRRNDGSGVRLLSS